MDEMITTEREYVRSLGYIIDSYFPEMERDNLPQDLRGKRNIIFGNLEKLYDFHCHYFLKELERCTDFPLRVSHCFLRHVSLIFQGECVIAVRYLVLATKLYDWEMSQSISFACLP